MRRGEVLALSKPDIDLEKMQIKVNKTIIYDQHGRSIIQQFTKSEAGMRNLPITIPLYKVFLECLNEVPDEQLFLTRSKKLINKGNLSYRWNKILNKINSHLPEDMGTSISPHYFRHNYATDLAYANIPVKTMQYLLGHSNANMSMNVYADLRVDWRDTTEKLDKYYSAEKYVKSMSA